MLQNILTIIFLIAHVAARVEYSEIMNFITLTNPNDFIHYGLFMENRSRILYFEFETAKNEQTYVDFLKDDYGKVLKVIQSKDQIYLSRCNQLEIYSYPNFIRISPKIDYESQNITKVFYENNDLNFNNCIENYQEDHILNCSFKNILRIDVRNNKNINFHEIFVANLSNNKITVVNNIGFFSLAKNIVKLDLQNNPIKEISSDALAVLRFLRILLITYDEVYVVENVLSKILKNNLVYIDCYYNDKDCYLFNQCNESYEFLYDTDLFFREAYGLDLLKIQSKRDTEIPIEFFKYDDGVTPIGWIALYTCVIIYLSMFYYFIIFKRNQI